MDWLESIEWVFEYKKLHKECKVKLVAKQLRVEASAQWTKTKATREKNGKKKVKT